jgi:hypothetical protein
MVNLAKQPHILGGQRGGDHGKMAAAALDPRLAPSSKPGLIFSHDLPDGLAWGMAGAGRSARIRADQAEMGARSIMHTALPCP